MKILWVKAGGLVPPDTGGKIRSYNILRELAHQHSVTFFSFYAAHDNDLHPSLESVFDRVVCIPLQLPKPKSLAEMRDYGIRLLSSQPYSITKYCRPEVRRKLHALLEAGTVRRNPLRFHGCRRSRPVEVSCRQSAIHSQCRSHNLAASLRGGHQSDLESDLRREWRKMEAAEQRFLRLADLVLTVSETDREAFAPLVTPESSP